MLQRQKICSPEYQSPASTQGSHCTQHGHCHYTRLTPDWHNLTCLRTQSLYKFMPTPRVSWMTCVAWRPGDLRRETEVVLQSPMPTRHRIWHLPRRSMANPRKTEVVLRIGLHLRSRPGSEGSSVKSRLCRLISSRRDALKWGPRHVESPRSTICIHWLRQRR